MKPEVWEILLLTPFLRKKKAIIFEFPLIFPTNVCLKKYNKKRLVTVIV